MDELKLIPYTLHPTNDQNFSPHDLLPSPIPMEYTYLTRSFYEGVVKHLVKDTVRIMANGLNIDMDKVVALEVVLDSQLREVKNNLGSNKAINDFLQLRYKNQIEEYKKDRKSKLKDTTHFIKPFNPKDMLHRSFFMNIYAELEGLGLPKEEVLPGVPKWPVRLVKKLAITRPLLTRMLEGRLSATTPIIVDTVTSLAKMKATFYNKSYLEQIYSPPVPYPEFNPSSPKQKGELFEMLGVESEATTKTGSPKWDRDQIVRVNTLTSCSITKKFTEALIDHSYAAIIRNNFIEAFYNYTIEGRLYGNYKLLGAKTCRPTSNKPNLLQLPSTGSIFARPVKECFTPPKGWLIGAVDYASLEQRILASLANEETLIKLYMDDLDGHSVHAIYYFPDKVKEHMEITGDITTDARLFAKLVEEGNKELKALRQEGKAVSLTNKRL